MKILQVVSYFPPAYAFGGPGKMAYQIARKLVERKHEVIVYTSDAKDLGSRLRIDRARSLQVVDGIEVHYFRNLTLIPVKKSRLFITAHTVSRARQEVETFDVIHLHEYRTFQNIVMAHYARKYGVPYVLQAHGSLPRVMTKLRLKWIYDVFFGYKLLRDASKVIALSQMETRQYMDMGVLEEKIEVIPNGIDLLEYDDLPPKGSFKKKFNIPEDKKIVLYLGRIHKTKRIDFLVKAYAYMTKNMKCNDAVLVIAGPDDGYLSEARSLVGSLGLDGKVLFTGMLLEGDKISAYVDSSICTYPNPDEPFGLVSLEAAASCIPVVVTEGTIMSEIVNKGGFGFSVKYGDVKALAKLLELLVKNDVLASDMGARGRQFIADNYSLDKVVDQLEKLYEVVQDL